LTFATIAALLTVAVALVAFWLPAAPCHESSILR